MCQSATQMTQIEVDMVKSDIMNLLEKEGHQWEQFVRDCVIGVIPGPTEGRIARFIVATEQLIAQGRLGVSFRPTIAGVRRVLFATVRTKPITWEI